MKIILFVPYFGKLPQYFPAFAYSCYHLIGHIEIQIFTDDNAISGYDLPQNIHFEVCSFEDMKALVKKKCGTELYSPYKLCDYKPCYGHLFEQYTKGFEFWGYCDIDLMFGDLIGFLKKIDYRNYDRIGTYGHLTLYKNTERNKYLYKSISHKLSKFNTFNYVAGTSYPCNFDELGMNLICKMSGIAFYEYIPNLNTSFGYKSLHTWKYRDQYQLWCWTEGRVLSYHYDNNKVLQSQDAVYLHFMMFNLPIVNKLGSFIYICSEGIFSGDQFQIEKYIQQYGSGDSLNDHYEKLKEIKKKKYKKIFNQIFQEFRFCGIRAFSNIFYRIFHSLENE